MNEQEIELYIKFNAHCFFEEDIDLIREELSILNDDEEIEVENIHLYNPNLVFLSSIFCGIVGTDRLLIEDYSCAFLKRITAGGFLVWWVIDWFLIKDEAKNRNRERILAVRQKSISDKKEE